jgi:succinylglutamate desuccinylase
MRVETLGEGAPEVAVVGAIHGDEPCGARAIERFLTEGPVDEIRRPVKLIIANERALNAGERFIEADLNRVFPGDPDSDVHEERLAHALLGEMEGCVTLGFHATVSFDEPFGTLAHLNESKAEIMRALPLSHAADFTGAVEGRSVNIPEFVNVEAGHQGSARAAENAYECLVAYLRAMDVLPDTGASTPTQLYRVYDTVKKEPTLDYRLCVENFERVAAGEVFAKATDDTHALQAEQEFWPVLMSSHGHSSLLGYKAEAVGEIRAAAIEMGE